MLRRVEDGDRFSQVGSDGLVDEHGLPSRENLQCLFVMDRPIVGFQQDTVHFGQQLADGIDDLDSH